MFQFTGFALPLYIFKRQWPTYAGRVSPFGNPRIKACLPAPRGLSQATTPFIACCRQGIRRMHLFTWPIVNKYREGKAKRTPGGEWNRTLIKHKLCVWMCLEVSYRNIRITERWNRNRSVVCAWKYHTEILELQGDGREIEVMYVLGSTYNTSISLPSLCNSNISVWYFQAHTSLLFLSHASLCNSNISVSYFHAHTSLL